MQWVKTKMNSVSKTAGYTLPFSFYYWSNRLASAK